MSDFIPELDPESARHAIYLRQQIGLLTERDLELLLTISGHTLQAWRSTGQGPKYVKLGRTVMYRMMDVQLWINNNVQSGTPAAQAA